MAYNYISMLSLFLLTSLLANSAHAAQGYLWSMPDLTITLPSWLGGKPFTAAPVSATSASDGASASDGEGASGGASASDGAGASGGAGALDTQFLEAHNAARRSAGHPPLKWDKELAAFAQRWLQSHQNDCQMVHSHGKYGENLYWSFGMEFPPAQVVKSWVSEKEHYNAETNSCAAGKMCGHYTQVVWRKTTAVGCATVVCGNNKGTLVACEYNPPGNYIGQTPFES